MPEYDNTVAISHEREEEGSYHRREYSPVRSAMRPAGSHQVERYKPVTITTTSSTSNNHNNKPVANYSSDEDEQDNFKEWTTSKRKVNHKTRQVETRVSRQLLVRGGEVIADSGPQVVTRIKEDNKVEECEKEKAPKSKGRFEALEGAPEVERASGRVLGEKKEIQRVTREVREENMQYHDERFKELTGKDVHRKALQAPHELITINDQTDEHESGRSSSASSRPRGKMVHYSNKGKTTKDTDEILEVAKLAIDGSITKEKKHTKFHEESVEDEKPDEKGEAEALRAKPVAERSSRRYVDYVNDFDEVERRSEYDSEEGNENEQDRRRLRAMGQSGEHSPATRRRHRHQVSSHRQARRQHDDEAFPRYEVDPLLNSLRDEDFQPRTATTAGSNTGAGGRYKEHSLERRRPPRGGSRLPDSSTTSDTESERDETRRAQSARSGPVEIPEEYRVNKQRLISSSAGRTGGSTLSHRSNRSGGRRGDAATQARLTDEETEERRRPSSPVMEAHERTARYLQRQSTPNSSRRYFYGDQDQATHIKRHGHRSSGTKKLTNVSSSSSSISSGDLDGHKRRQRHGGATSRDSGFRSPNVRSDTPQSLGKQSGEIYSVSSKSRREMASPTPSGGQRSVKTTTTTLSAGLAERPLSRTGRPEEEREQRKRANQERSSDKFSTFIRRNGDSLREQTRPRQRQRQPDTNDHDIVRPEASATQPPRRGQAFDTVSISSLMSPAATKILVPYRRVIEIERDRAADGGHKQAQERPEVADRRLDSTGDEQKLVGKTSDKMSFEGDIVSLSKRLASISRVDDASECQHFDYKTLVADVGGARNQVVVGSYNVHQIEQNSPFHMGHSKDTSSQSISSNEKNNNTGAYDDREARSSVNNYDKYRATPALADLYSLHSADDDSSDDQPRRIPHEEANEPTNEDDERASQVSSVSLQSARTYNIRKLEPSARLLGPSTTAPQDRTDTDNASELGSKAKNEAKQAMSVQDTRQPDEQEREREREQENARPQFDENGNGKPAAWIFDPRDNSSTAIVPPTRPRRPETPKLDAKTEELAQARGGRSYYLELTRPQTYTSPEVCDQRPSSLNSLHSRWNSQYALSTSKPKGSSQWLLANKSRPNHCNNTQADHHVVDNKALTLRDKFLNKSTNQLSQSISNRRQLPFGGAPPSLGDRSKSSSCLLNATKTSKYSIYGGFKKPGEANKPVPRLSYSRAIGPRSTRASDSQPKVPSRYLKMR